MPYLDPKLVDLLAHVEESKMFIALSKIGPKAKFSEDNTLFLQIVGLLRKGKRT